MKVARGRESSSSWMITVLQRFIFLLCHIHSSLQVIHAFQQHLYIYVDIVDRTFFCRVWRFFVGATVSDRDRMMMKVLQIGSEKFFIDSSMSKAPSPPPHGSSTDGVSEAAISIGSSALSFPLHGSSTSGVSGSASISLSAYSASSGVGVTVKSWR